MIKQSSKIQSISHSAIWALGFWLWASLLQIHYQQEVSIIIASGVSQGVCTITNWYINLRLYNSVKKKVYDVIDNKTASEWSAASISWLETLLATILAQKIIWWEWWAYLGMLYWTFTFVMLPTAYEKGFLKKN